MKCCLHTQINVPKSLFKRIFYSPWLYMLEQNIYSRIKFIKVFFVKFHESGKPAYWIFVQEFWPGFIEYSESKISFFNIEDYIQNCFLINSRNIKNIKITLKIHNLCKQYKQLQVIFGHPTMPYHLIQIGYYWKSFWENGIELMPM